MIGPKIPSSSTPTWRWTAATASPVSPNATSEPEGIEIAEEDETGCAAGAPPPLFADASAANGVAAGPTAIVALTATAAPLRRAAPLRAASVISRRCCDRRNERSQSSKSLRSRL